MVLSTPDPKTFCAGEDKGYVDYPALTAAAEHGTAGILGDCSKLRMGTGEVT
jgi:hypothetical protein